MECAGPPALLVGSRGFLDPTIPNGNVAIQPPLGSSCLIENQKSKIENRSLPLFVSLCSVLEFYRAIEARGKAADGFFDTWHWAVFILAGRIGVSDHVVVWVHFRIFWGAGQKHNADTHGIRLVFFNSARVASNRRGAVYDPGLVERPLN